MAATDMRKAGFEPGAQVWILGADQIRGSLSDTALERLAGLRGAPWEYRSRDGTMVTIARSEDDTTTIVHLDDIIRDYSNAQRVRQDRFSRLIEHYPGEAGVPTNSDTIERYVLVQARSITIESGSDEGAEYMTHAFTWGDTFDECVFLAGGEVLDGWMPEAVFDLDTGMRIELHVSSPVITKSEDQGVIVNVLNDHDLQEQQEYRKRLRTPTEAEVEDARIEELEQKGD